MRRFELTLPRTVDECLTILGERAGDTRLVAGGTDLLPQLKNGLLKPACVVDLSGVAALRTLQPGNGDGLRLGAAVTARAIERDPHIRATYPALAESGALVGSVQIRNLATVGGNLCNAAPSADMAAPLLALDAEAVIVGRSGQRRVPLASFFVGVRTTVLAPDELLLELIVPAPGPRSGGSYLSQNDLRVHFGIGKAEKVDLLEIRWPSGQFDTLKDVKSNQLIVVKEGEGILRSIPFSRPKLGKPK